MARNADFIVIGAGIAGMSVATPGYHSTGRSAAVMSENYGPTIWSRLVTASRSFLETPPEGFAEVSVTQ